MMKRAIATVAATAAITAGVAVPANAVSVSVDGEVCTYTYTAEEARILGKAGTELKSTKAIESANLKNYKEAIIVLEKLVSAVDGAEKATPEQIEAAEKELVVARSLLSAAEACVAGKDQASISSDIDATLSTADDKLTDAGIGVVVAGAILAVIAIVAAAFPAISQFLPI